jgi:2-iminobutanoate/2-iminopropanoate deaminase
MQRKNLNPMGDAYAQAVELTDFKRLLFISGQIPETEAGKIPDNFKSQCLLTWENVQKQLSAANMGFENLVKVTIFLADRQYRDENKAIRKQILGDISPAITIIITGIFDEKWLLEIEAIAAL